MMLMDMTAELAPLLWGMIGLWFVSGLAILSAALQARSRRQPLPMRLARQRQTPRQVLSSRALQAPSPASARS